MDVAAWGVVEVRPGTTGGEWLNSWLDAQKRRMEVVDGEYDELQVTARERFEDEARELAADRREGWITRREICTEDEPETLQCLWGVTEAATFEPVAADRGVPEDLSPYGRAFYDSWAVGQSHDCFGETCVTAAELTRIDWTEQASRRRLFVCDADGEKVAPATRWRDEIHLTDADRQQLDAGEVVRCETPTDDDPLHVTYDRLTRRDALTDDWNGLLDEVDALTDEYDDGDVRVTVWFDC